MADADGEGELYVLELLAELRGEAERLHRDVFETSCRLNRLARTLSNGNLPNVPAGLNYAIEMWDRHSQCVRWTIALCGTSTIARGAFDVAVKNYPNERWTLRQGIRLLQEHEPAKGDRG